MANIVLEFDSVTEYREAMIALKGLDMLRALNDIEQALRREYKHGTPEEVQRAEYWRDKFYSIIGQYDLVEVMT